MASNSLLAIPPGVSMLTAGVNVASVSNDFVFAEYGGCVLFALGGVFEIDLSDRMSIRFEPMFL